MNTPTPPRPATTRDCPAHPAPRTCRILGYLDVDGPLNVDEPGPGLSPHLHPHHIRIQRSDPDKPWKSSWHEAYRVWLHPGHGALLNALADTCAVDWHWATTWNEHANREIGTRIGLPALPVVTVPQPSVHDLGRPLHRKVPALLEHAAGRPFLWVDDEITEHDAAHITAHHPGHALLINVSPTTGYSVHDIAWTEVVLHALMEGPPLVLHSNPLRRTAEPVDNVLARIRHRTDQRTALRTADLTIDPEELP